MHFLRSDRGSRRIKLSCAGDVPVNAAKLETSIRVISEFPVPLLLSSPTSSISPELLFKLAQLRKNSSVSQVVSCLSLIDLDVC